MIKISRKMINHINNINKIRTNTNRETIKYVNTKVSIKTSSNKPNKLANKVLSLTWVFSSPPKIFGFRKRNKIRSIT